MSSLVLYLTFIVVEAVEMNMIELHFHTLYQVLD